MAELQWARILVKLDEVCLVQPRLWLGQCVFLFSCGGNFRHGL